MYRQLPEALYNIDQTRASSIFLDILSQRQQYQDKEWQQQYAYGNRRSQWKHKKLLYKPATYSLMKKVIQLLPQLKETRALELLNAMLADGDDELRPYINRAIKELQGISDWEHSA